MAPATAVSQSETHSEPAPDPWAHLLDVSCQLTADLPIAGFKVRDLLRLAPHFVLGSQLKTAADVPVRVNGTLVAWCEFEVVGNRLAVRITAIA
jgi:flagellar motor switch/type III secretory pathway protein FliN